MQAYDLVIIAFRIAGLVLLFVLAMGIFLNVLGYVLVGGEVKNAGEASLCKLAVSKCINFKAMGTGDCFAACKPCEGDLYYECLKGDLSLLT